MLIVARHRAPHSDRNISTKQEYAYFLGSSPIMISGDDGGYLVAKPWPPNSMLAFAPGDTVTVTCETSGVLCWFNGTPSSFDRLLFRLARACATFKAGHRLRTQVPARIDLTTSVEGIQADVNDGQGTIMIDNLEPSQAAQAAGLPDSFEPYEGADPFDPVVEIVCRDGSRATGCALAFDWEWRNDEPPTDIIGYRVIAPRFEASIRDPLNAEIADLTAQLAASKAREATARADALEEALAAMPATAVDPNESWMLRGHFNGVMDYQRAIRDLIPQEQSHEA